MKKVLITILGRGKFINEKKGFDYEDTYYQIENNPPQKSKLVGAVLNKFLKPDEIIVVGTNNSLWNLADKYIKKYNKIIIPYGKNQKEFWEIFDIFSKLEVENSEILFDITHGFRSIPLFVSTILNFFKNQKNAIIKGVYYGIFEAKHNDITPVINVLPFIELNNWIEAGNIFSKYGDGREIKNLIEKKFAKLAQEDIEKVKKYKEIKNIANELEIYTKSIGFAAVDLYLESIEKIGNKIEKITQIPKDFKAFEYILSDLNKESKLYCFDKKWKRYLKVVEIFFHKNRYAQALTLLRELMHYYIYEELNIIDNIKEFDRKISGIINEEGKKDSSLILNKKFIRLIDKIKQMRNRTNHAFLGEGGRKTLNTSIIELENLINQCKNLLMSNEKIIIDSEKLKELISKYE